MAKHKIALNTEYNAVELRYPDGRVEYYQPAYGTALDLYDSLKATALEDPTAVLDVLQATAELVQPETAGIEVDTPEQNEGAIGDDGTTLARAGGGNPYDSWNIFGNNNNLDIT